MSFDITKNYLVGRLKGLGFSESKQAFNFENAAKTEFDHAFILNLISGELTDEGAKLSIRFIDNQEWSVAIAFSKSSQNDVINRDSMYRKVESIIKDLDDPDNWLGTLRYLRYSSYGIEEFDNYFLLTITLIVQDAVNY